MSEKKQEKSFLEEALDSINTIGESLDGNAKEILRNFSLGEINSLVSESLNEDFGDEEDDTEVDSDVATDELDIDSAGEEETDSVDDMGGEDTTDDIVPTDDTEDVGMTGSEEGDLDNGYEEEEGIELDYTSATDDEVISVFKRLRDTDEVEIISNDEIKLNVDEPGEYTIKMDGSNEAPASDVESTVDDVMGGEEEVEDYEGGEDTEFEVELDVDDEDEEVEETVNEDIVRGPGHDEYVKDASLPTGDIEGQKADTDTDVKPNIDQGFDDDAVKHANAEGPMVMEDEDVNESEEDVNESEDINEEELDESIPVGNAEARRVPGKETSIKGPGAKSISESKEFQELLKEHNAMKAQNVKMVEGIKKFKKMLSEVAVYNTNLTLAVKLFTEHSTTQDEKRKILEKFDNEATTLAESKKVYKNIVEGFSSNKTTIAESIDNKMNDVKTSSKSEINESVAYEDKSTARIKQLMYR